MNLTTSLIRISILLALLAIAICLILTEPICPPSQWLACFITSKLIGAAAIVATARLYKCWHLTDHLLQAYDRFCDSIDRPTI